MVGDFTKKFSTTIGVVSFTFSRIYSVRGVLYFVHVTGRGIQQYFFHMEEREGLWKIIKTPAPPEWLLQHEDELAKAIQEQ